MEDEEKSVFIRREVLNSDELYDHFSNSQFGLSRLIPKSRMHIALAFTPRKFKWSSINLDKSVQILNPPKNSSIVTYGSNRVLAQEFETQWLLDRQSNFNSRKITFFELDNFKPHLVLDFNLDEESDISKLKTFKDPIILGPEKIDEADLKFRKKIKYRKLKKS